MTYKLFEKGVLTCDGCGKEETQKFRKDRNPTMEEHNWLYKMSKQGWTFRDEGEQHYCPACSADVSQDEVRKRDEADVYSHEDKVRNLLNYAYGEPGGKE